LDLTGAIQAMPLHLNEPADFRTVVHGFLYSQEYALRFGPI